MNQHKIALLKQVKARIEAGKDIFICVALNKVNAASWTPAGAPEWMAAGELHEFFSAALHPYGLMDNWLVRQLEVAGLRSLADRVDVLPCDEGINAMARRAWLDKMIHDLENQNGKTV